ncbi:MAG: hypothetical protein KDK23_01435 [Leptospiraceae bacterium]|nr:hypothetical protein [Leptospiraceae bacterium]
MNDLREFPGSNPETQTDNTPAGKLVQDIRAQQSLAGGVAGGLLGAALGAGIWALVTAITHYQIGFIAMVVGILVGFGVRILGKGIDTIYGIIGGALALVGCAGGNLLAVLVSASIQEDMNFLTLLSYITPDVIADIYQETFSPMDLLFYGIAIYEGYRFAFRQLTDEEVAAIS